MEQRGAAVVYKMDWKETEHPVHSKCATPTEKDNAYEKPKRPIQISMQNLR